MNFAKASASKKAASPCPSQVRALSSPRGPRTQPSSVKTGKWAPLSFKQFKGGAEGKVSVALQLLH